MEDVKVLKKDNMDIRKRIKNIIFYCKSCGYIVSASNYKALAEVEKDANIIRYYGNEPSVRRAIKLLNLDNKIKEDFEVIMGDRVKERLELAEIVKQQTKPKFKVSKGIHKVIFLD